jgi:hypothetical protein
MGTQPPHCILEPLDPSELDQAIKKGEMLLEDVTQTEINGQPAVKVHLKMKSEGTTGDVFYGTNQGYMSVGAKLYNSQGQLVTEVADVKLQSWNVDGNVIYYPVAGEMRGYYGDAVAQRHKFTIPDGGLRLNQPIPESRFRLAAKEGEVVWDMDMQTVIIDPGKVIDLTSDIAPSFDSGGQPQRPATTQSTAASLAAAPADNHLTQIVAADAAPSAAPAGRTVFVWRILAGAAALVIVGLTVVAARRKGLGAR